MKLAFVAAVASLAALATALAPVSSPAQPTQSTVRDAPRCLQVRDIQSHTAISDREILFDMGRHVVWKNTLRASCPGLKFENAFAWDVSGGEVCANQQTLYVLRRGNPCQLGDFSRYTPPPRQ